MMEASDDRYEPSEEKIHACATAISDELKKSFFDIMNRKIAEHFPQSDCKVNYDTTVRLMIFPGIMLTGDIICALMSQLPEEDRSKKAMEWLSQCNQTLDFIVSDTFATIKKFEAEHGKQNCI